MTDLQEHLEFNDLVSTNVLLRVVSCSSYDTLIEERHSEWKGVTSAVLIAGGYIVVPRHSRMVLFGGGAGSRGG